MADSVISEFKSKTGCCGKFFCGKKGKEFKVVDQNQNTIKMNYFLKEAPNPSDILWANLEVTTSSKFWARLWSNVLTLLLVSVSFFCILGLKILQRDMTRRLEKNKSTASSLGLRAISLGVAFIIVVINTALSMAIKKLTETERFSTSTNFFKSMTYKIVFVSEADQAQFINTNILMLIVHVLVMYPEIPIYSRGAVMIDAWFILISQCTVNPLMNTFNIWYYLKQCSKSSLRKKVQNGEFEGITQADAHATMEQPVWDPSWTHASMVKDILTCIFFQPIFPISGLFGMVAFFLMYWSQKHRLLYKSNKPVTISKNIAGVTHYLIALGPLVYGVAPADPDKLADLRQDNLRPVARHLFRTVRFRRVHPDLPAARSRGAHAAKSRLLRERLARKENDDALQRDAPEVHNGVRPVEPDNLAQGDGRVFPFRGG